MGKCIFSIFWKGESDLLKLNQSKLNVTSKNKKITHTQNKNDI